MAGLWQVMTPLLHIFFDSNIYIHLLRKPELIEKVQPFLSGSYLFVLNKIILMELWAGASTELERDILQQHQKTISLIGLSDDNFITAGRILNQIRHEGDLASRKRRRITWDILIALSAKENQALLVTENDSDFRKIKRYVDFEYVVLTLS